MLEEGGKLVVRERVMLEAQVVPQPRHKNFDCFYFNPLTGKNHLAMKN